MVNPGAFHGTRKAFLTAQKALYAEAVTGNHVADAVADIQRRYFKRYPISLPHTEEPTAAWLAAVDDNGPDEDLHPPDKNVLDDEAFKTAQAVYEEQVKLLRFRKGQITRRLAYEHAKDNNPTKRITAGTEDPMAILMAKLAGIPFKKPRVRTGFNVWGQNNRQFVDPIYEQRVKDENVPPNRRAAVRMQVYKECFAELDEEERNEYESRAVEEHRIAVEKIEGMLNAAPSQAPEDRQQVLKNLPTFVQPILDLIASYSGWKATLLVGGPEPADNGRLNMMSFHAGETAGNIKMNFGRSERRAYKNLVMPVFGGFLKKCYSVEDCRAAAIPNLSQTSLAEILQQDGGNFSVDSVEDCTSYIKVARPSGKGLDSNTVDEPSAPATYQIPHKVGPPIHAQKQDVSSSPLNALPEPKTPSPVMIEELQPPSCCQQPAHSPVPSPIPSPAPSRAPSPYISPLSTPQPIDPSMIQPQTEMMPQFPAAAMLQPPASSEPQQTMDAFPQPSLTVQLGEMGAHSSPLTTTLPDPGSNVQMASPAPTVQAFPTSSVLAPHNSSLLEGVSELRTSRRRLRSCRADDPNSPRKRPKHSKENSPPRRNLRSSKGNSMVIAPTPASVSSAPLPESVSAQCSAMNIEPTSSITPQDLAGSPNWFLNAYQMFFSVDLGPSWAALVRTWAQFEREAEYQELEKLGTTGRPPCISAWIARARAQNFQPDLGSLPMFEKNFNIWWTGLQPEWRQKGAGNILDRRLGDLEEIRRPGRNGILSVIAALFFWAAYGRKKGSAGWDQAWMQAVGDVHWVIGNLRSP